MTVELVHVDMLTVFWNELYSSAVQILFKNTHSFANVKTNPKWYFYENTSSI